MSEKRWKIKKEHPWIVLLPDNALLGEGNQYVACGGGGTEGSAEIARLIVKDHNDVVYLRTKRKELEAKNKALLEALKNWNKSFKSVIEHKHHFDTNVFNLFNERYTEARKAIAEAIQGESND